MTVSNEARRTPPMHNDTDNVARAPEHAPINWVTMILFTALPLAAVTVVPWYGFTHGFSLAAWVLALVSLWACGLAITCLLYTSPSPRDLSTSRMPSSA